MNQENKNLLYAITFFLGCFGAIQLCEAESTLQAVWFMVWIFISLPILLLCLFEVASVWRQSKSIFGKILGWNITIFQTMFVFFTSIIGTIILIWIVYNLLIERHPQFTDNGFIVVPIMFILFGWFWLKGIFFKPLPKCFEWLSIKFDDKTIFVQTNPPKQDSWSYQFAWADINRVYFEQDEYNETNWLYIWTTAQDKPYVLPIEADGGLEFFKELNQRKLITDNILYTENK